VRTDLAAPCPRHRQAFNDRDFDVWREVFDEDVELLIDGMPFRGVDAAVADGGRVTVMPACDPQQVSGTIVNMSRILVSWWWSPERRP
jgi:hypothetical protein